MRTARMLNDAVEKFLKDHPVTRESRVLVRVYADMTNLSKHLAKTKVIGLEKRSLMPFAAGFTRALGGFDFMDSLDEEGTRFKIRGKYHISKEMGDFILLHMSETGRKLKIHGFVLGSDADTVYRCFQVRHRGHILQPHTVCCLSW